jgi:hypothetical protein
MAVAAMATTLAESSLASIFEVLRGVVEATVGAVWMADTHAATTACWLANSPGIAGPVAAWTNPTTPA